MKPTALVLVDDSVCFTWLRDTLADQLELVQLNADDEAAARTSIEDDSAAAMLFLQFDGGKQEERCRLTEALSEVRPDLPVIALALGEQTDLMLAAMRSGARDFVVPEKNQELRAAVEKALRRKASMARASKGRGRAYTVFGAQPLDAIPFLGMHLALAMAEQAKPGERVLFVDCSFPAGAAQVFLNIDQNYGLQDALGHVYRCDQTLIDTAFPQHDKSGLFMLGLPETQIGPPQINPDELNELLVHLAGYFSAVVLGIDSAAGVGAVAEALKASALSVLLSDQSILKSRQNKQFLDGLRREDAPLESVGLVVDNYKRRLGLEPQKLAGILDVDFLDTLEGAGVERINAMNAGVSLFENAPREKYCADVRRLAAKLTGAEPVRETSESRGLFNRLLS